MYEEPDAWIFDEINPLFIQLEECEYYGDRDMVKSLSKKIHRTLRNAADNMLKETSQHVDAANLLITSSEIIQDLDFYEAITAIKKAIAILDGVAQKAGDECDFKLAGDYYRKIADIYGEILNNSIEAMEYYKKVISCYESHLSISEEMGSTNLYNQYYTLAELHYTIWNWNEVESYARKAIEISIPLQKYYMIATSYKLLLQNYLRMNKRGKMVEIFLEAREFFQTILQSLTINSKKKNYIEIADIYHVFASFYDLLENIDEFKNISDKEASCYLNLAENYMKERDIIASAIYYHSAGLVFEKIGKFEQACDAYMKSANYYEKMGILDSSADNYIMAANCLDVDKDCAKVVNFFLKAAHLYEASGYLEMAIAYTQNALDIQDFHGKCKIQENSNLINYLVELLDKKADSGSPRETAYFSVETAYLLFQEKDMDGCLSYLKNAHSTLKQIYSMTEEISATTSHDLLALIIISLILEKNEDVSQFFTLLENESVKTPIAKQYYTLAKTIKSLSSSRQDILKSQSKSSIIFNIPFIRNLITILNYIRL